MSSLPDEILTLTFVHLKAKDLLQCQLTSKQWHKASLKLLYADLIIRSENQSRLLIHTISNSSHLGRHINTVDFRGLFRGKYECPKRDLYIEVIENCPNLTGVEYYDEDFKFWMRIMCSATRGFLSQLKTLPQANSKHLEYYIFAAFHFKNTLSTI